MKSASLVNIVQNTTGQDLQRCWTCLQCDPALGPEMDVSVRRLIHMVLLDDGEALQSLTLWSGHVLRRAARLCPRGLDLEAVLLALREEGWRRGIVDTII
jgi:heterodisulfide reductase subunit C